MTNFQSVNNYIITVWGKFIIARYANTWVDGIKFVVYTTIPDVLPFFKAELRNTRYKLAGREFHAGYRQAESNLGCTISFLVARHIHINRNRAEFNYLPPFLPRCSMHERHCYGKAVRLSVRPSVCPSVKRVHCDKTKELSANILILYERSMHLVFWYEEWLLEDVPFYLKFKMTADAIR